MLYAWCERVSLDDNNALVAQWIERLRPKEGVGSSILSKGAISNIMVSGQPNIAGVLFPSCVCAVGH